MSISDHALGVRLRELLIRDWYEGVPADPQRLRSLASDLCRRHPRLRGPMTHLVLSPVFRSVLAQDPPLRNDGETVVQLMHELRAVFSAPLCDRMEWVLQGLLPLAEGDGETAGMRLAPVRDGRESAGRKLGPDDMGEAVTVWARSPHARSIALGSLLGCTLVLGLAGLAFWAFDSRELRLGGAPSTEPSLAETEGLSGGGTDLLTTGLGTGARDGGGLEMGPGRAMNGPAPQPQARQQEEIASRTVEAIYTSLARGDAELARSLMAGEALQHFRAASASHCRTVEVTDLQEIGHNGPTVDLDGVIICRFADGSLQKEARRFRIDIGRQPPRLLVSRFEGIVRPRSPATPTDHGLATTH